MASKSFGSKKRPAGKEFRDGIVGEALDDVYNDIEEAFAGLEGGSSSPRCHTIKGAASAAADCEVSSVEISGANFLLGGTIGAASLEIKNAATPANTLVFDALDVGKAGNDITITIDAGEADAVTVDGKAITITLDNDNATTGTEIKAVYDAVADAVALATLTLGGNAGDTWHSANDAAEATKLDGGKGDTLEVFIGGEAGEQKVAMLAASQPTDTLIKLATENISVATNNGAANQGLGVMLKYGDSIYQIGSLTPA
tara:strand:+ start:6545 stop:7315 length:771 start_codon:yes stop_codon:yes gene_type:complete